MNILFPNNVSHTDPTLAEQANRLRLALARKRDELVKRQRRNCSQKRQQLIDQLGDQYRLVYQIFLDCES